MGRQFLYYRPEHEAANPYLPTAGGVMDVRAVKWEAEYLYYLNDLAGSDIVPVLTDPIPYQWPAWPTWYSMARGAKEAALRQTGQVPPPPQLVNGPKVFDAEWDPRGRGWIDSLMTYGFGSPEYRLYHAQRTNFYHGPNGKEYYIPGEGAGLLLNRVGMPFVILTGRLEPTFDGAGRGWILGSCPYDFLSWKGQVWADEMRRFMRFAPQDRPSQPSEWWGTVGEIYVMPDRAPSASEIIGGGPLVYPPAVYRYKGKIYAIDGNVVTLLG